MTYNKIRLCVHTYARALASMNLCGDRFGMCANTSCLHDEK